MRPTSKGMWARGGGLSRGIGILSQDSSDARPLHGLELRLKCVAIQLDQMQLEAVSAYVRHPRHSRERVAPWFLWNHGDRNVDTLAIRGGSATATADEGAARTAPGQAQELLGLTG